MTDEVESYTNDAQRLLRFIDATPVPVSPAILPEDIEYPVISYCMTRGWIEERELNGVRGYDITSSGLAEIGKEPRTPEPDLAPYSTVGCDALVGKTIIKVGPDNLDSGDVRISFSDSTYIVVEAGCLFSHDMTFDLWRLAPSQT